jgi:hypothetical protein
MGSIIADTAHARLVAYRWSGMVLLLDRVRLLESLPDYSESEERSLSQPLGANRGRLTPARSSNGSALLVLN